MIERLIRIDGTIDVDLGRVRMIRYELEDDGKTPIKACVQGLRFVQVITGFNAVMLSHYVRTRVQSAQRETAPATMTDYFVSNCECIIYTRDPEGKVVSAIAMWPDGIAETFDDPAIAAQIYRRLSQSGAIGYHLAPVPDMKAEYDARHASPVPPTVESP
jgi:hypothetical protein